MRPCQQPLWVYLTAVNLKTGEFRWRSVLGIDGDLAAEGDAQAGTVNPGGSIAPGTSDDEAPG
jgi:glucose dehydrogenase